MDLRMSCAALLALTLACSAPVAPAPSARGEWRDESRAGRITPAPTTPKPAPTAVARKQEQWSVHERVADGFAIALPPSWKIEELGADDNPAFKLLAVDPGTDADPDGVRAVVQVIRFALKAGFTFDTLTQLGTAPFERSPGVIGPVTQRVARLQAGPALETRFREKRNSSRGEVIAAVTHYELIRGNTGYVLMLWTLPDQAQAYAPTFEKIAVGFQFR